MSLSLQGINVCYRNMFEVSVEKSEQSIEMGRFNDALRQVIRVSKEDLNRLLADEKAAISDRPKRGPKRTS
jgi:hypothetical protein